MNIPIAANARPLSPEAELARLDSDPRPSEVTFTDPASGRPFLRMFPTGKIHCADPRGALKRLAPYPLNPMLRTAIAVALRLQAERDEGAPQILPLSTDDLIDDPRLAQARQRGAEITVTMSAGRPARWGVYLAGGMAPLAEADSAAEARSLALQHAPAHPNTVLRVMRIEETIHVRVDEPVHEDEL